MRVEGVSYLVGCDYPVVNVTRAKDLAEILDTLHTQVIDNIDGRDPDAASPILSILERAMEDLDAIVED